MSKMSFIFFLHRHREHIVTVKNVLSFSAVELARYLGAQENAVFYCCPLIFFA
jgi:hypothetical protein